MNNLARLGTVKDDIAGVSGTTVLDDVLERAIEQVSREFESDTGRSFVALSGARYLARHPRDCGDLLKVPDLASLTSVAIDDDGDGVYELTVAVDTDFWTERDDDLNTNTPIYELRVNPNSSVLSSWPTAARAVKVTGLWGYSYETEATGLTIQGGGINGTALSATVSAAAGALVFAGDTVVLESEQVSISDVSGTTLTFGARGLNGTTAAAHAAGTAVLIRRYPRDVERVVAERVVGLRWDIQSGYAGMQTLVGEMGGAAGRTTDRASFARWRHAVKRYKDWRVS